ncbi:MAG TPA: membrane protein insertase YidC [Polyangiaceae bacterium]|nr:membrane protein insertase YidC [Polyangiaceae bacterium]
MERGNLARWLLLAVGIFLLITFGGNWLGGSSKEKQQPSLDLQQMSLPSGQRAPELRCDLFGERFSAQISSRGASLKRFTLTTSKYKKDGKQIEVITTPDQEFYQPFRFHFSNRLEQSPDRQVDPDTMDWTLVKATGTSCELSYKDDKVELTKTIQTTPRPYELDVNVSLTNRASRPLKHAVTVHTDTWRTHHETAGSMLKVSPLITRLECVPAEGATTRLTPGEFEPGDFADKNRFPTNTRNAGDWYEAPGLPAVGAVSNAYFTQSLVPLKAPGKAPVCQARIEQRYNSDQYSSVDQDPHGGSLYRVRLAYPELSLEPGQSASYSLTSYSGPLERALLTSAADGKHRVEELIDLGFFSAIAKVLVTFLLKVHGVVGNWGIAIVILTITARTLLFPLALPSIKGMIKMRELKPELDALNEKFKDDAQAKGLAQMELWRKHNVNPLKGCLPQLASMPVWFALYTTLQTAVELYNIPFLWFPDLSSADPLYILPFIIGATSFFQQKIMPPQGDPAQQKMMLYFMPAMFTVFMLFLPAGLGVYMFTNGVLGILQQQGVEWHARRTLGKGKGAINVEVVSETKKAGEKPAKDKLTPKGKVKQSEDRPQLGNGKA